MIRPSIKEFELLFQKLRLYTHEACVEGRHWDPESAEKNIVGRKALRELSLDLTAAVKSFEEGRQQRANRLWGRALEKASKPQLLDTWYFETPIALLFELGRLVHSGHGNIAALLIQKITFHAKTFLSEKDPRHSLFAAFESLEITQLESGYSSAALSLLEGLATRLEKHNPLLYTFGLHRALDLVWFDPKTDLKKWVVPVKELDKALGPDTALSVYFLLLDAYRQVAAKSYSKADDICQEVSRRLKVLKQTGQLENLKIGMAYRRLGRQYYEQEQYDDARRILNQALRYIGTEKPAVLVEIYHLQEKMARIAGDNIDVDFWQTKISQMDADFAGEEQDEIITPTTQFDGSFDDTMLSDTWASADDYLNNWSQPVMFPNSSFQGFDQSGYGPFPTNMNVQTAPTMYFNQDNSGARFTDDPESLLQSSYGTQMISPTQNGTINPALTSINRNSYPAQPGMISGYVYELPQDYNAS